MANLDPKLKEALAIEGFLGKQRPGAFHTYQQRYCKLIDGGTTFAYAKSKEDFDHNKISGQFLLKDILDISSEDKPKKFQVIIEGRVFKFEAHSIEEKTKWVEALKICRDYALHHEEQSQEQMKAFDSDIRFEENTIAEDDPKQNRFNPVGIFGKTVKDIVVGTVVGTGAAIVGGAVNKIGNAITDNKPRSNEEYLKAKKFDESLNSIDNKILQCRLMMGYLLKETKEATGNGLVDGFVNEGGIRDTIARRWCFLISSKPIILDQVDPSDEETVENGKLPFDIEAEVLYIYYDTCDGSKPLESIQIKDVVDIVIKKKAANEQYYRFVLDTGEKKINLLSTSNSDMTKWVMAIQASRATVKERFKSKLPKVKNIYWHLKIMTDEGEDKLREKMMADYDKLIPNGSVMGSTNITDLLKIQEKVIEEFIAVINACLVHKDQKTDIIKVASEVYHESILKTLKTYFEKNKNDLQNRDIFDLVQFINHYRDKLKIFGDAFIDKRMVDGVATLCRIVATRILRTNMKTITNIVKQDVQKEPEVDGKGQLITNAPVDIFKVLNETFNVLSFCNTKELSFALLDTCSHSLQYFVNGLSTIFDYPQVTLDHLIAFCNNTLTYNTNIKDFTKLAQQLTGASKEIFIQYFDEAAFTKSFIKQGKKSYELIAEKLFASLNEQWMRTMFLDIKLAASVNPVLEQLSHTLEKLNKQFEVKIEAACLEKVVINYVQAFLISAEKKRFKPDDLSKITAKFGDDQRALKDIFPNVRKSTMETCTKPISEFLDFLETNYSMMSMLVRNMKEEYGSAIKWSTIELLIKLRNDQMSKEEKNELFKDCENVYKTTQRKHEKHVEQNTEANKAQAGRQDSEASFIEEDSSLDNSFSSDLPLTRYKSASLLIEGFLEVEKDEFFSNVGATLLSNLKFEVKFFNLKRDILYYYKDKTSETAQGSYKLKDAVDFGTDESDRNMFFIIMRNKEGENKTIRFKASTPEKKDMWLTCIKKAAELKDYASIEISASDLQLYKDTKPLFIDLEEMPNLEFPPPPRPPKPTKPANTLFVEEKKSTPEPIEIKPPRKKSFDINDAPPVARPVAEKNCFDRCSMF